MYGIQFVLFVTQHYTNQTNYLFYNTLIQQNMPRGISKRQLEHSFCTVTCNGSNGVSQMMLQADRGVGRNCRKGGAQFKAAGFWRKAPKIWGCNRKPHLLFNDSLIILSGSSPANSYSVHSAHVQGNSLATPSINYLSNLASYRIASCCIEVKSQVTS